MGWVEGEEWGWVEGEEWGWVEGEEWGWEGINEGVVQEKVLVLKTVTLTLVSDCSSPFSSSSCASSAFLVLVMTPILLSASVACWSSSAFSDCALVCAACRLAMVLSYSLS